MKYGIINTNVMEAIGAIYKHTNWWWTMKKVFTTRLVPGMIIGNDVYNQNGLFLIAKGTGLTDEHITILTKQGIPFVDIDDSIKEQISVAQDENSDSSYFERLKQTEEYQQVKQKYDSQIHDFSNAINDVVMKNVEIDTDKLFRSVMNVVDTQQSTVSIFDMLHSMRDYDDATFVHSFNVALICNVFSKWLHWSEEDTRLAVLCGLLHDVGKLMIPEEIIKKPAKLTDREYTIIQRHSEEGYRFLRSKGADVHICNAALMHHERADGKGYPLGLNGNQIDPFAKIVSIADVYDAMTSPRVYRGPLCPFQVIEMFEYDGIIKYDPSYLMPFLQSVADTYINNTVELSDGRIARIIMIHKGQPSRPLLLCDGEYLNLLNHPQLKITCLK